MAVYTSNIVRVRFSFNGSEDNINRSYSNVETYDVYKDNKPYPNGCFDGHMGTNGDSYECQTCYNRKADCPGHDGSFNLSYPVWNPLAADDVKKWLRIICHSCGHSILDKSAYAHYPINKRLDEAQRMAKTGAKRCVKCHTIHPAIKKSELLPKEPYAIEAVKTTDGHSDRKMLYPHIIADIFNRISDETIIDLGKSLESSPRNFILTTINIPSVVIRPEIKKTSGGKNSNNTLTTTIQVLIKKSAALPAIPRNEPRLSSKLEAQVFDLSNLYTDFIRARGEGSIDSITANISGKPGLIRRNILGKRAWQMCRSTIINDPRRKVDEVGIPVTFAKIIRIAEVVQEYNKGFLTSLLMNGTERYPGASELIKKNTKIKYRGSRAVDNIAIGDTVLRDVITGDVVNFNRQPSLTPSQIACHKVVVNQDNTILAITMNVIACNIYKADFDGDAMHLIFAAGIAARNEIASLSPVAFFLKDCTNGNITMPPVEDAVIGTVELTQKTVRLDKYHIMQLLERIDEIHNITKPVMTGRECFSLLLSEVPTNFRTTAAFYKPAYADWMKYDTTDTEVIIEQGRLESGVVDRATIGGSGLFHAMATNYGNSKTLRTIFNIQQMAICYILQHGYTIGIMDMLVDDKTKKIIEDISTDIINKSRVSTEALNTMNIVPPIGKTISEFYEEQQINILREYEAFYEPIIRSINTENNNLFKLINYGSKGVMAQMVNLTSNIGQKIINGERMEESFGPHRASVYFKRFDERPQSRGYIANSYISGMNPVEFISNAMYSRFDLISNALLTSVTGMQWRLSGNCLQSLIISNLRCLVKGRKIIQCAYGGDYVDVANTVRVKFPTVLATTERMQSYMHPDFPEQFAQITADREKYRSLFLKAEHVNVLELIADDRKMGVDPASITYDLLKINASSLVEPSPAILKKMVQMVDEAVANIPYVLINEIQERMQTPIPLHVQSAAWLVQMAIRSVLHPNALVQSKMTPRVLTDIINKIRHNYGTSLIQPGTAAGTISAQSFSGPLTQYMLDSKHRSHMGGTSKSVMSDVKEIIAARPVDKLQSAQMIVLLDATAKNSEQYAQEIASAMEVVTLSVFTRVAQVFYEEFGNPVHPTYAHETGIIKEFLAANPLLTSGSDLIRWCIRFVINRISLIVKNVSLELIVEKLRAIPGTYIVYTPENAPEIVIRVYLRNYAFKHEATEQRVADLMKSMLTSHIRGIEGIVSAQPFKIIRNEVRADGSIARAPAWGIKTNGTNITKTIELPGVDPKGVFSNAIVEMYELFGVEAARVAIISAMKKLGSPISYRHYSVYADEMSYTGKITPIETTGLKAREYENVLLRLGVGSTRAVLTDAAVNNINCEVRGVSGPLMVGQMPRIGTNFNNYYVNEEFVRKNTKSVNDILDVLY